MRDCLSLPLVALSLTLSTVAVAQDQSGDYTTQSFPSSSGNPEYAQSAWKVVANHLNCRKRPGTGQTIVGVFHQGNRITAETSVGSRDNLPTESFIKSDAQGKPWMKVKEFNGCFVRANRVYIAPDKQGD
jgi:hypothetical protein